METAFGKSASIMKCTKNVRICASLAVVPLGKPAPIPAKHNVSPKHTPDQWVSVSYEPTFDNGAACLNVVACSDGKNGIENVGYSTLGSLPSFPLIGASPTISGWNSPNCGRCYEVHCQSGSVDRTIHVLAVDACAKGFDLSLEAMNHLTDGQAVRLGRVNATYCAVDNSACGGRGWRMGVCVFTIIKCRDRKTEHKNRQYMSYLYEKTLV